MHSLENIGKLIRSYRTNRDLPLRKLAAQLDLDPSTLSKIERGVRFPNETLIKKVAKVFLIDERELLILYHSEKIAKELYQEDYCSEVLKVAEKKIEYIRQKKSIQGQLF